MITHTLDATVADPSDLLLTEMTSAKPSHVRIEPDPERVDANFDYQVDELIEIPAGSPASRVAKAITADLNPRLWAPKGLIDHGAEDGPHPPRLFLSGFDVNGGVPASFERQTEKVPTIRIRNGQMSRTRRLIVRGGGVELINENTDPDDGMKGQSEHADHEFALSNCHDVGLLLGGSSSFRGMRLKATIHGASRPLVGEASANLYGLRAHVVIGVDEARQANGFGAACILSSIHNAEIDLLVENKLEAGSPALYLGEKRSSGRDVDGIPFDESTQRQGSVRLHTVHTVPTIALFEGSRVDLPWYRFTHGNPHNGNRRRAQWHCADGQVFEHEGRSPGR